MFRESISIKRYNNIFCVSELYDPTSFVAPVRFSPLFRLSPRDPTTQAGKEAEKSVSITKLTKNSSSPFFHLLDNRIIIKGPKKKVFITLSAGFEAEHSVAGKKKTKTFTIRSGKNFPKRIWLYAHK